MTRRDAGIVAALAVIAAGMVYALTRALHDVSVGVPHLSPFWWGFIIGALSMIRVKGRMGEYRQAVRHSISGVLRGHLNLIRGKH